jgi:hypothetical protein
MVSRIKTGLSKLHTINNRNAKPGIQRPAVGLTEVPNIDPEPLKFQVTGSNKTGHVSYNDPRFDYSYKGFCSIVCGIIDMSMEHHILHGDFNLIVDEPQTLQLFDSISTRTEETYDLGEMWLERYFNKELYQSEYNAHTLANIENLKLKNFVYKNVLKIKDEYLRVFESKRNELEITNDTLGIQIRGTDKKDELPEIKLEKIYNLIDQHIVDKVFVSTDDKMYLDAVKTRYGTRLIYDTSVSISDDRRPLHFNSTTRAKINEEVLSNVHLLSSCGTLLYSFSNVSLLALILGANNFKGIYNINGQAKRQHLQLSSIWPFSRG